MRWIAILVLLYVAYATTLFCLQRRLMYPGASGGAQTAAMRVAPAGAEPVLLATRFGEVEAWYVATEPPGAARVAVLVFHGNAELARDLVEPLRRLSGLGAAALFVEYPGYGNSAGDPGEQTIVEAAEAGYDWLSARSGVGPGRLFALGRSLGSGAAAALSRTRPLAGLVLWSPFVSSGYLALRSFWVPPVLVRDRFDTRAALAGFPRPVLILHGRRDRVIPARHAAVLAAAGSDTELVLWDCGHNDCPPSADQLWQPLTRFFEQAVESPAPQ